MLGNYSGSTDRQGGVIHRELRRQSDPLRVQHLWDAIRAVRQQKQIPAIQRMSRYMNRFHGLSKDATQKLLDLAVEDNLVKLENKIGTKGTKSGVEEKAYRWPTLDMLPRERHDWYCFHCHAGGDVVLCGDCHRVYHEACLKEPLKPGVHTDDFLCHYCRTFQAIQGGFENGTNKRERKDLNHLLGLTCKKLRAKMPPNLLFRERPELKAQELKEGSKEGAAAADGSAAATNGKESNSNGNEVKVKAEDSPGAPAASGNSSSIASTKDGLGGSTQSFDGSRKVDENDDSWRVNFMLKQMMDFDEIAKKCSTNQYRIVEEFRADCQLIVHNVVIYHGGHSHFADLARQMFRDCTFDIRDITVCRDCYRYANENPKEKYWYCKPCRPFHELIYARLTQNGGSSDSGPWWPAKVMRVLDSEYDVRFFGGYHQRALVDKSQTKAITVSPSSLGSSGIKRSSQWTKACEELRKHQELLEKVKKVEDFLKEPFAGDPFASDEMKALLPVRESSDDESSDSEPEPEQTLNMTAQNHHQPMLHQQLFQQQQLQSQQLQQQQQQLLQQKQQQQQQQQQLQIQQQQQLQQQQQQQQLQIQQQQQQSVAVGPMMVAVAAPAQNLSSPSAQLPQAATVVAMSGHVQDSQTMAQAAAITLTQDPSQFPLKEDSLQPQAQPPLHATPQMQPQQPATPAQQQPQAPPQQPATPQQPQKAGKKKRGRPKKVKEGSLPVTPSSTATAAAAVTAAVPTTPPESPAVTAPQPQQQPPVTPQQQQQQQQSSLSANNNSNSTNLHSESENQVSSSSPNFQEALPKKTSVAVQTPNKLLKGLVLESSGSSKSQSEAVKEAVKAAKKEFKQYLEKMRADFDQEKKRAVNVATRSLERDLERLKADHTSEMEEMAERHKEQMSQNKKKQWCYNCETEAIYWCCWNTAYCSIECQQKHWHAEHKRACRRKR